MKKNQTILYILTALFVLSPLNLFATDHGNVHWSYLGKTGPQKWSELSKDYKNCKIGKNQSPINIDNTLKGPSEALEVDYKTTSLDVINNGHTIQANYSGKSMLKMDGKI